MLTLIVSYLARGVLIPITLAVFFRMLLIPVVRSFGRLKIPYAVTSFVLLACFMALAAAAATAFSGTIAEWFGELPKRVEEIQAKVIPLKRSLEKVSKTAESIETITEVNKPRAEVRLEESSLLENVLSEGGSFISAAGLFILLLYFMLVYGDDLINDFLLFFFKTAQQRRRLLEIIMAVEQQISKYLGTVCSINILLAAAEATALWQLGMPNPLLWGVLAGSLNFVPYLGAVVGTAAIGLTALFTFPEVAEALVVPLVYYSITAIEGSLVTPMVLGLRLVLNPVLVLTWVVFWAWMWGIAGAFLAVPLLVAVRIVITAARFPERPLHKVLFPNARKKPQSPV